MTSESKTFNVPVGTKISYLAICFVIVLICAILFAPKMSLASAIGVTIAATLFAFPKININNEALIEKGLLSKAKLAAFNNGQFSIETMTGLKAIILGLSIKKKVIYYQANGAKHPMMFAVNYPDAVIEEIFRSIPDEAKIPSQG